MPNKALSQDVSDSRVVAAIGYIGILCLLPLLGKKDSPYAQFHGKQGLVLFLAWIVIFVIGIIPILGTLIAILGSIILAVLSIVGLIKAYQGELWELPYLGQYAKKIKL